MNMFFHLVGCRCTCKFVVLELRFCPKQLKMWSCSLIFFLSLRLSDFPKTMQNALNKGVVVVLELFLILPAPFQRICFQEPASTKIPVLVGTDIVSFTQRLSKEHSDTPLHLRLPKLPLATIVDIHFLWMSAHHKTCSRVYMTLYCVKLGCNK